MLTRPPFHLLATALVSRQFVPMTRIRIEGLLAAFPKLVGTGKQHTYVETENVRYVYQPLDQGTMYLLLVTNKQRNILEDLDILRLLSKVLPEYTQQQVDEDGISRHAFDLIFAFDEVILARPQRERDAEPGAHFHGDGVARGEAA